MLWGSYQYPWGACGYQLPLSILCEVVTSNQAVSAGVGLAGEMVAPVGEGPVQSVVAVPQGGGGEGAVEGRCSPGT